MIIVDARDADEAAALFRDDPWTIHGILGDSDVVEWTVFLDSLQNPG